MFRLDEVFEMDRCKGALSRKRKKIEEISVITPALVCLHVFEEKGCALEPLGDFEMVITDILVMGKVLGPDPGRLEEFDGFRQFAVKAEVTRVLEVTVRLLLAFP